MSKNYRNYEAKIKIPGKSKLVKFNWTVQKVDINREKVVTNLHYFKLHRN